MVRLLISPQSCWKYPTTNSSPETLALYSLRKYRHLKRMYPDTDSTKDPHHRWWTLHYIRSLTSFYFPHAIYVPAKCYQLFAIILALAEFICWNASISYHVGHPLISPVSYPILFLDTERRHYLGNRTDCVPDFAESWNSCENFLRYRSVIIPCTRYTLQGAEMLVSAYSSVQSTTITLNAKNIDVTKPKNISAIPKALTSTDFTERNQQFSHPVKSHQSGTNSANPFMQVSWWSPSWIQLSPSPPSHATDHWSHPSRTKPLEHQHVLHVCLQVAHRLIQPTPSSNLPPLLGASSWDTLQFEQ